MNRFQSILDNIQLDLLLDLSDAVTDATGPTTGHWLIDEGKLAFRDVEGILSHFDYAKDDMLSQALVAMLNHAHDIARNIRR